MKAPPVEIVYINGGEIYKSSTAQELSEKYLPDPTAEDIFPFRKYDGKQYFWTSDFKTYFGGGGQQATLDGKDLAPAVKMWAAIGAETATETSNYDLFFAVESSEQLRDIAAYYRLPYPCGDKISYIIDYQPETISYLNYGGTPFIPGGVKFIDGKPVMLKLYTYPKPFGTWDVWMYGASYRNGGEIFEKGAVFTKLTGGADLAEAQMRHEFSFKKAEVIYTTRADGVQTTYGYVRMDDPLLFWQGNEINDKGEILRVKRYESSYQARLAVTRMTNGPKYEDRNLCPAVEFWLGRGYYDDSDEEELLFAVTGGSAQLAQVAAYYKLPVPYSDYQQDVLDNNPLAYRARHYQLDLSKPGVIPIIVASVTFKGGEPVRLLLYTFLRPWEFSEAIDLGELWTPGEIK